MITTPAPAPQLPLTIRCDDERSRIPEEWDPLPVAFAAKHARKIASVDPDRLAALLAVLRAGPELAAHVEGFRVDPRDTRQVVLRRMEAVASHLRGLGVPPEQVQLAQLSQVVAREAHAVEIRVVPRHEEPVSPGEPCGTTTLRISTDALGRSLAAHGLWAQGRDLSSHVRDFRVAAARSPLDPLMGVGVAPLVRHDGGYLAAAQVLDGVEFGLFNRRGRLQRVHTFAIVPESVASSVTLVARERGFLAAWSSGGEIHTLTLDPAGEPLRSSSREVVDDAAVHALAMDRGPGAGGIVYSTIKVRQDDIFTVEMALKFVPIDEDGHAHGAPRTFMAHERWIGSIAVATLSPDRVGILVDGCDSSTMRLDADGQGELVAVDRQFLRQPLGLGVAVVRRATGVWAASLSKEWIDLRPFCAPPAATLVPASP